MFLKKAVTGEANASAKEYDEALSRAVYIVERKMRFRVDENYPLMKFFFQLEMLKPELEEEEREYWKAKGTFGLRGGF